MNGRPEQNSESADSIEARAAAWLAQRDEGMSPEDAAAFAQWRRADPRHDAAVAELEQMWGALLHLRGFRPGARSHPDYDLLAPTRHPAPRPWPRLALAAIILVLVAGGIARWAIPSSKTYSTTTAGYQQILLDDGTVMELRAQTEVEVRFTSVERRVHLRRGEAHFTIARNPARPFLVNLGDVSVRAVGTAFNVIRNDGKIEVLVTEGRVRIEPARTPADSPSAEYRHIHPGERAMLAEPLKSVPPTATERVPLVVETLAPERIREALAWQGPRLVFLATPLAEVVAEFNRYNALKLSIADPSLASIPVGGSFRAENVDAFVRLLAEGNDIAVERVGNRIELRRSPRR